MKLEYFIAKRIIDDKAYKSSISAPIIKIGILAIALGIIVMLIAIATGTGLQREIRTKIVAFNGDIIITNYDNNNSQESEFPVSIKQPFYPEFTEIEAVSHIQAVAHKSAIIRQPNDFEYIIVKGVGPDYNWNFLKTFLIAGKLPDYSGKRNQEVLISEELAKKLRLNLGDKINTYFVKKNINKPPNIITYSIVGIFNSGYKEFDSLFIIGDIRHIQRLNKWESDQVGHFEVFVNQFKNLRQIGARVYDSLPPLLDSQTIVDKIPYVFQWIKIFDKNIFGIIAIMILVAGINMITALLVLILERTQMIGILKALGCNNKSIRNIFIYNATYLILKGLIWGNLIGLSLLLIQKYFKLIPLDPNVYYVSQAPVYINVWHILALNIGTFILCILMLLIPSYIITKISPVKAIKFN